VQLLARDERREVVGPTVSGEPPGPGFFFPPVDGSLHRQKHRAGIAPADLAGDVSRSSVAR